MMLRFAVITFLFRNYRGRALGVEQGIDDRVSVDRHAVIVPNRLEPTDEVGWQFGPQYSVELSVAVLFDHINAFVAFDEGRDFGRQRQRPNAHVIDLNIPFTQAIARLDDGVMRRAIGQDRDLAAPLFDHGRRYGRSRRIMFAGETIEITLPYLGLLRITRFLVVSGPARKEARVGMFGSRKRAVRDAVFIELRSSTPSTFPRSNGFSGYGSAGVSHEFMPRSRSLSTKTGV